LVDVLDLLGDEGKQLLTEQDDDDRYGVVRLLHLGTEGLDLNSVPLWNLAKSTRSKDIVGDFEEFQLLLCVLVLLLHVRHVLT
jgi:hypothetical protein